MEFCGRDLCVETWKFGKENFFGEKWTFGREGLCVDAWIIGRDFIVEIWKSGKEIYVMNRGYLWQRFCALK